MTLLTSLDALQTARRPRSFGAAAGARCGRPARAAARPAASAAPATAGRTSTFEELILDTQQRIIAATEQLDGSGRRFAHDRWQRSPDTPNAGYGITSVLDDGAVLEKAAVNVSVINGVLTPERARAMSGRGRAGIDPAGGQPYSAAAMSLIYHSAHPYIPTLRADVRVFDVAGQRWYGGGCDLTPFYVSDFSEFHHFWKALCDARGPQLYPEFKAWCDEHFYIGVRKEARGVGGIFFDDLEAEAEAYDVEGFVRDVAGGILPSWEPIVTRRRGEEYSEAQRQWQLLRRGRYLEFNLLHDRGVKFGLDGGRIESIMVSAPPLIAWRYSVQPQPGTDEAALVELLQAPPREWV
eukprot:scaffold3.g6464.t1